MKLFSLFIALCILQYSCAQAPVISPTATPEKKQTIAVWDLENLSPSGAVQMDLGNIISARIIEAVQQGGYSTIEREKLEIALRELNLGSSSLADSSTRLRIGKITGAKWMIFGAYQVIADKMRLDLRLVDVETGRIVKTSEKTAAGGDLSGWLKAAEVAAKELF